MFHPKHQSDLLARGYDGLGTFANALTVGTPWDNVIDFASHPSFCNQKLYPRQRTLLKLIYLETESMSQYDIDVINEWRLGFQQPKDVFGVQPDIWDRVKYLKERGYHHFPHVQAVLGRRASKGFIGGVLGAERFAYFYSLDNWQSHFNLAPGVTGWCQVVATSQGQAKRTQFADIRYLVENCKYLQESISISKEGEFAVRTPSDLRRIAEMKAKGVTIEHEIASLRCVAQSTNSGTTRGVSSFMMAYDEFAHQIFSTGSTKSGDEVYEASQPSLDQFGVQQLTYLPSSPLTKIGLFFELYRHGSVLLPSYTNGVLGMEEHTEKSLGIDAEAEIEGLTEVDPEMLIFQGSSFELYKDWERSKELGGPKFKRAVQVYDDRMKRLQVRNPEKFSVERLGQFAAVQDAYLDPDKVDLMFAPVKWREPLKPQRFGYLNRQYRIHCDPGRVNANFALAIAHLEDAPCDACGSVYIPTTLGTVGHNCPEGGRIWPHVIIDYLQVWQARDYPDHTIDYRQVREEIQKILRKFPSTEKVSFDQWNAASMVADLKHEFSPKIRVVEEAFTQQVNQDRFEDFKSLVNLGWIHSYEDHFGEGGIGLLEQELKFLSTKNGKVDKQDFGPITTKDLADCVMVIATDLLHNALDQWVRQIGAYGAYGSSDASGLRQGREWDRLAGAMGGSGGHKQSRARQQLAQNTKERMRGSRLGKYLVPPSRGGRGGVRRGNPDHIR